jgi:uncharacterized protein YciI
MRTKQASMARLNQLSELVARRNAISGEIAAILGRPAQIGHLGEFLAAELFGVELEAAANNRSYDGRFTGGVLAGKTVDVKTYPKREGIIDLRTEHLPDYYLVIAGPKSTVASSRGQDRPWIIDSIHLFDAKALVEALLAKGLRVSVAASVSAELWAPAEVYPDNVCQLLALRPEHEQWLAAFGRQTLGA